jgi:VanZ family protein
MLCFSSRRFWLVLALVLYWLALFIGTHLPLPDDPQREKKVPHGDKLVHAAAFAGLALLVSAAIHSERPSKPGQWFFVLLILTAYAAVDELSQGLVRNRVPDGGDWVADIAGVMVGIALFSAGRRFLAGRILPADRVSEPAAR